MVELLLPRIRHFTIILWIISLIFIILTRIIHATIIFAIIKTIVKAIILRLKSFDVYLLQLLCIITIKFTVTITNTRYIFIFILLTIK